MLHHLRRTGRSGADQRARALEGAQGAGGQPRLLETVSGRALGKGGLIALAVLAGCSTPVPAPEAVPGSAPAIVEEAQNNPPVGTRMPQGEDDLCKARDLQWLVGRHRTEIPVPVEVVNRRVICTTCPVTLDYSPYRLNIFFNAETNLVEQVRCG